VWNRLESKRSLEDELQRPNSDHDEKLTTTVVAASGIWAYSRVTITCASTHVSTAMIHHITLQGYRSRRHLYTATYRETLTSSGLAYNYWPAMTLDMAQRKQRQPITRMNELWSPQSAAITAWLLTVQRITADLEACNNWLIAWLMAVDNISRIYCMVKLGKAAYTNKHKQNDFVCVLLTLYCCQNTFHIQCTCIYWSEHSYVNIVNCKQNNISHTENINTTFCQFVFHCHHVDVQWYHYYQLQSSPLQNFHLYHIHNIKHNC